MEPDLNLTKNQVAMLAAYSALISRARMAAGLGLTFGGDRDIYEALGWKKTLTYTDYALQYERQDMAKAVINRPIDATWSGEFSIVESDNENETALEKAWAELYEKFHLKQRFIRLDKLASLGKYGIFLLGLDDVKRSEDMQLPVNQGNRELMYLKPLSQGSAAVHTWEEDASNERYGMPLLYNILIKQPSGDGESEAATQRNILVHHSRVIHVTGELLESEVLGEPALKVVFNRLQDLEKTVGGSAEMFWRGARPGYQGKVEENFQITPAMEATLQDQINEYEHNLRRILINQGIDLKGLEAQVSDPAAHVDIQIQMISAVTGIPKRILTGSERGELASSQDKSSWLELVQARQLDYAEVQIVRPFVDLCIAYGILPGPSVEYTVDWPDLFAASDKEKADVGKVRAEALAAYAGQPDAQFIVPPDAFCEYMLGLEDADTELIKEMRDQAIVEEEQRIEEERVMQEEAAAQAAEQVIQPPEEEQPTAQPRPVARPTNGRPRVR